MRHVQSSIGTERMVRPIYRSVPKKLPPQFARTPSQILRDVQFMPNGSNGLSYGSTRDHSASQNVSAQIFLASMHMMQS